MPKVKPWYSTKGGVYHDNTKCTLGDNPEPENIRRGDGDKRHCKVCAELNRKGR